MHREHCKYGTQYSRFDDEITFLFLNAGRCGDDSDDKFMQVGLCGHTSISSINILCGNCLAQSTVLLHIMWRLDASNSLDWDPGDCTKK